MFLSVFSVFRFSKLCSHFFTSLFLVFCNLITVTWPFRMVLSTVGTGKIVYVAPCHFPRFHILRDIFSMFLPSLWHHFQVSVKYGSVAHLCVSVTYLCVSVARYHSRYDIYSCFLFSIMLRFHINTFPCFCLLRDTLPRFR